MARTIPGFRVLLGVMLAGACACTAAPPEPSGGAHTSTQSASALAPATAELPGYEHTLACTKFDLGANVRVYTERGYQKNNGTDGIFSVNLDNHAARAISHPSSPALQATPYGSSLDEHNQHVLDYFVGCGIARDQVASVDGGTVVSTQGPTTSPLPKPHLVWYTSSLVRAVDGIPIVDSVAWARFNAKDQVVGETVYWPTIPSSVINDAKAFRAKLSDPSGLAAFQATLPTTNKSGRVVIRHRDIDNHKGTFSAVAVYDVVDGETMHHFDSSGQEVRLPWQ